MEKVSNMRGYTKNREMIILSLLIMFLMMFTVVMAVAYSFVVNIGTPNNTNTSDSTPNILINFTSDNSSTANCSIYVDGSINGNNASVSNATNTNITVSTALSDGSHSVYVYCVDNNSVSNQSSTITITIDTTYPSLSFINPTTDTYQNAFSQINATITDSGVGIDSVRLYIYNGSHYFHSIAGGFNETNIVWLTPSSSGNVYNYTTPTGNMSDGVNYTVLFNVNDTLGNEQNYTRSFTYDNTAPTLSISVANITGGNMSAQLNTTVSDSVAGMDSCYYTIYSPDGSVSNKTATTSGSGGTQYCYVELTPSDLSGNGKFTVQITAEDGAGNSVSSNSTNWTINYLESGWTLLQADRNGTLKDFNLTSYVTKVSWYNNSDHTYTTWVKGTSTNENTSVIDGDAIYVYSSSPSYYIRYWNADVASRNVTLTSGWNQLTHFNISTITAGNLCDLSLDNSSVDQIYVTYIDTDGIYKSHRCGFSFNANIEIPRGYGYWVKVNGTTTMGVNRE